MTIQFIVIDGFSMMALLSAIEPLRAANRLTGETLFAWSLVSDAARNVTSSSRMEIPTQHGLQEAPTPDLTIVIASLFPSDYRNAALFSRLRRLRNSGRMIGAISSGTLLLAKAGVLGDHRVTIHWETARELEMTFPNVKASSEIFCWDRNVLTSARGAAAMDLMLALIVQLKGTPVFKMSDKNARLGECSNQQLYRTYAEVQASVYWKIAPSNVDAPSLIAP